VLATPPVKNLDTSIKSIRRTLLRKPKLYKCMYLNSCAKAAKKKQPYASQFIKVMKLTIFIITIVCLQVSAKVYSQINVSQKNAPLIDVLNAIQQQTDYSIVYKYKIVENIKVTINLHN
jgi:hypothetical protein